MRPSLPLPYEQDSCDNSLRHEHILLQKTTMSRTTFEHIPLARPAEQIRLLKLQPGTQVIRLSIQTYELAECPAFVALSYEWGDDSEIYDIIIDGAVFKTRQNLFDALGHIRTLQADTSSTRLFDKDSPYFWIDAIAIDQASHMEKPHQVSMMGKIYRRASHVIAWLGIGQNGDGSAMALDYLNDDPPEPDWYHKLRPDLIEIGENEKAISKLCSRSYFRRIWIVQECVLARKLHLVCGLHYCYWKQLYNFNEFLHYERQSQPVNELFLAKSQFEKDWDGSSIQDAMSRILRVVTNRTCSRFHDRIYGLLGILQQSFQTTGMEVNYEASLEELMTNTKEFLENGLEHTHSYSVPWMILDVFKPVASIDVLGKVMWYWQVKEIMKKLDAHVIKGFHMLETLCGAKERALTFQTICWIVGGYGIDLFSPVEGTPALDSATAMQTFSLESQRNDESRYPNYRVFIMRSQYTMGTYTYGVCLTHWPSKPHGLPDDYIMTESKSRECRNFLEVYSKHVKSLGILRENSNVSTEVSDRQTSTQLPIQVEWMVFSNLLAQHFYTKFEPYYQWGERPNRTTKADGFVRQIEREGKDLGTFLSESLFNKYRMSVASTSTELPANALMSVQIEITCSNDAGDNSDFVKNMVASLYDNDYSEADWEDCTRTEPSEDRVWLPEDAGWAPEDPYWWLQDQRWSLRNPS